MTRFVLDASVAVAWCFQDQQSAYTEFILSSLAGDGEAAVPALWPTEMAQALVNAERRGRLTAAEATRFLERLSHLPISVDSPNLPRVFDRVLPLAREHRITAYDAAYLELALRLGIPIATIDTEMLRACRTCKAPIARNAAGKE